MTDYLDFILVGRKPKTDVYGVVTKSDRDELGRVAWFANWRQYCFFPKNTTDTIFSSGCLSQIIRFIDALNKRHREQTQELRRST